MSLEVRLEDLLGRRVLDRDGNSVGRLEEVVAEWQGDRLVVTRYLLGVRGLLRRLSGRIWRAHGVDLGPSYAAKWDQLDISDPLRLRLTCPAADLDRWPSGHSPRD